MVGLDGSVWMNTQYHGNDYTPTEINNCIILYMIGDVFNGRYWSEMASEMDSMAK